MKKRWLVGTLCLPFVLYPFSNKVSDILQGSVSARSFHLPALTLHVTTPAIRNSLVDYNGGISGFLGMEKVFPRVRLISSTQGLHRIENVLCMLESSRYFSEPKALPLIRNVE
jgi:hypothetical protein